MNPKYTKLVESLTGFSTNLQKGEQVLMDAFDTPESMVVALVRAARKLRALPFVNLQCGLFVKGKLGKLSPNYLLNG